MKTIEVHRSCAAFDSFRANLVRSLFNAPENADFHLTAELPADETDWQIGVIYRASGTGKSSLGKQFWDGIGITDPEAGWHTDRPVIDEVAADETCGDRFREATQALASVGLGTVPAWLRPYHVLSCGEKFRAGLARIITAPDQKVIIDEFTSALDRQVAKVAAHAFAKAWRRRSGQVLILTCHSDVVDWLEPDWSFNTNTGEYVAGRCRRRPQIEVEIRKTNWSYWKLFEPHHYLRLPNMVAAKCYVGFVDGEPVCHCGVTTKLKGKGVLEARVARLVVMPEWQGIGIGTAFLRTIAEANLLGSEFGRHPGFPMTTIIHTAHPGLAAALRRDRRWRQVSASLFGSDKLHSLRSLEVCGEKRRREVPGAVIVTGAGWGGHFRAVQGFRYVGTAGLDGG